MDPQEYNIWKTAKAQGKDDAFIKGAILSYRSSKSGEVPAAQPVSENSAPTKSTTDIWRSMANSYQSSTLGNVFTGAAKGLLSTGKGIGTLGQTVLDQTAGRLINAATGRGFTKMGPDGSASDLYRTGTPTEVAASNALSPDNLAQEVGFGVERIAESFIPASAAARGEQAINILSKGINSPIVGSAARIGGKGLIQGLSAGVQNFFQTGGDIKSSLKVGGIAAATRGAFATIGEGVGALKLPERLYSTIFKNTSGDMLAQLKSGGVQALQRDNPARFKELVDSGIIHLGKDGGPIVNESLAKEALDRGLRGSTKTMANTLVVGALDAEHEAQTIAQTHAGTVSFPEKQFVNVLNDVKKQYADVGFGELSAEADRLNKALKATGGELSVSDALSMRRLLDKLRISTSFAQPAAKLSLTQSNFKALADAARQRVNAVPGMGDVMKNYSFNIEALESLAKEAARAGNNQVLSLIDSVFLGAGISADNAAPAVSAAVIRKYLLTPGGKTFLANVLNNATKPMSASTGALLQSASTGAQSMLSGQ